MHLVVPALPAEPWLQDPVAWNKGPSPHLSWSELNCKDGSTLPAEWRLSRARPLAVEFECVRATVRLHRGAETSIRIGSAYRTESWNRKVGGSRLSQHVQGKALDLWTPSGVALIDLLDAVLVVSKREGGRIRGIGVYPWGVHIDIREGPKVVRWKGVRVSPEVAGKLMAA
ncbi:MAG: D-Ala-D-Ala carboxypeptidase family metallohydrolase [Nitrospiraceae bacterium]